MSSEDLSNPTPQPSTARRRLLRGVLAGAAVLPVGAGATSVASNLRCVKNIVDPGSEPGSVDGGRSTDKLAADGVSRVPLYKSEKTYTDAMGQPVVRTRYWVKGADLHALRGGASVSLPLNVTSSNFLLSSSTRSADAIGSTTTDPAPALSGWSALQQNGAGSPNRYVAVRFDSAGNMVGTADTVSSFSAPVNNSAVHRTCWSSFSGVNFNSLS